MGELKSPRYYMEKLRTCVDPKVLERMMLAWERIEDVDDPEDRMPIAPQQTTNTLVPLQEGTDAYYLLHGRPKRDLKGSAPHLTEEEREGLRNGLSLIAKLDGRVKKHLARLHGGSWPLCNNWITIAVCHMYNTESEIRSRQFELIMRGKRFARRTGLMARCHKHPSYHPTCIWTRFRDVIFPDQKKPENSENFDIVYFCLVCDSLLLHLDPYNHSDRGMKESLLNQLVPELQRIV